MRLHAPGQSPVKTSDFQYDLPPELIAQQPAAERDASRLLVLHRSTGRIEHRSFRDLVEYLAPGDVMVLNDSRVIPARLRGIKEGGGARVEMLLVEEAGSNDWWVMLRPGKRIRAGTLIRVHDRTGQPSAWLAEVLEKSEEGHYRLRFAGGGNLLDELAVLGEVPLPPYIARAGGPGAGDVDRYQTVYAQAPGSVAAPTAGLHFTPGLMGALRERGIRFGSVTLHVGLGTFAPVKADELTAHRMHEERFELGAETAALINEVQGRGQRVWAVGTTSVRVLESVAARTNGPLVPMAGRTDLFVYPPRRFSVVGGMVTNFHLPESTLLMLVSAFASPGETSGRELVLRAYAEAVRERYRFFSYGDAMLLV